MLETIVTSVISFISTNIDNVFVMMILYSKVDEKLKKHYVVIGQYLGLIVLVTISLLGAFGMNFIPQQYIGLLGLIPIGLGIKELITNKTEKPALVEHGTKTGVSKEIIPIPDNKQGTLIHTLSKIKSAVAKIVKPEILNVALIAIANGADNIGVYIPLFTGYSAAQLIVTNITFALLMSLWCFFGNKIASLPVVNRKTEKYKHIIVPTLFIGLGIYIIVKTTSS